MSTTVKPIASDTKSGNGRSGPYGRRWGDKGRSDPVARHAAEQLGLREAYLEKLLRAKSGINIRCAEIIKAFRALGDEVRLERFFGCIRAAYENRKPAALTSELLQAEQEADFAEDIAETRFLMTRSDRDLSLAIRAMDSAIVRQIQMRDALGAEEQRRMRQH
jgi:hypothetical protein